jgi:kumamolisin
MKRSVELLLGALAVVVVLAFVTFASAQELTPRSPIGVVTQSQHTPPHVNFVPGELVIPKTSLAQTPPAGHKFAAHTNIQFFIPNGVTPEETPPYPGYGYETPASMGCVYGLTTAVSGCNPNNTALTNPTGGSQSIAIVDAYDDPSAESDLAWFSLQFGLPLTASQIQVVWADTANSSCYYYGVPVEYSGGWEMEEALDIEWAHAMAPSAKIYLVEACSNYDTDLQQAVLVANNLVQCGLTEINPSTGVLGTCPSGSTGKGEVSISWGGSEFYGENGTGCAVTNTVLNDSCFTAANVVYFAASGDGPGVIWPSTSPNVVSAGGLTTRRNPATFNLITRSGWVMGGGGQSAVETIPSYQGGISSIVGTWRGTPDLSFNADPFTGVYVYDTFPIYGYVYQWWIMGGTSVSAPSLAGIINRAGAFAASSNAELTTIYANRANTADFTDMTSPFCGPYMGYGDGAGWDFCTGVGAVKGYAGK